MPGERHRALEPLGVGHQPDLHEDAGQGDMVHLVGPAVAVAQARDLLTVARDFGGLCTRVDGDIGQAEQFAHQHGVCLEGVSKLQHGHVLDHAGQVDGRFDPGVAATDHGHGLALEERPVTVRAVGHPFVAVRLFSGDVHLPPTCAGGQND